MVIKLGLPLALGLLVCLIFTSMCLGLEQPQHNRTKRILELDTESIFSPFFGGNKVYRCHGVPENQPDIGNSFEDSRALCNIEGGVLASFASQEEFDFIQDLYCDFTNWGNFWIGLKRNFGENHFKWISGEPFASFSNWAPTAPDLEIDSNLCALTKTLQGQWYDAPCTLRAGRICMFIESLAPSHAPTTSRPSGAPSRTPSLSPTPPTTFAPSNSPVISDTPTLSPTDLRGAKSFYAYEVTASFEEARSFCERKGMQLASILTHEDRYLASKTVPKNKLGWIGLYWPHYWTDGSPVTYTSWESGTFQPDVNATCVFLHGGNGHFGYYTENSCSAVSSIEYVICHEYDRYVPPPQLSLPKYFQVFARGRLTWFQARDYCMDHGMTMATFMNTEEYQAALAVFCSQYPIICGTYLVIAWIGLRRNQTNLNEFRWVDGSSVAFSAWAPNEPNNPGYEDCVQISTSSWNDLPCSQTLPYVFCQSNVPPTLAPTSMQPSPSPTVFPTLAPTSMHPSLSPTGTPAPSNSPTYAPNAVLPGRTKGYWLLPGEFTWTQAKEMCESRGMRLGEMLNDAELDTAKMVRRFSVGTSTYACWIGLQREPYVRFKWDSGVPYEFTYWAERDSYGKDWSRDACVITLVNEDLKWTETLCDERFDSLCEYDATKPLSTTTQSPSNNDTLSEACSLIRNITTSLKGNRIGDSPKIVNDGIPIFYDLCTNFAHPWFQRAVAFRYEVTALKAGNYSFEPLIELGGQCQEVWISMAVSSYSCDILPDPLSLTACSSWALLSEFGTSPLTISISERSIFNFHLVFRATINDDSLEDCLRTSNMSLNLVVVPDPPGDSFAAWIAVMVVTLCVFGMYWCFKDQSGSAIFIALLIVGEIFAIIGYLIFAGVTESVEKAMICLFFVPGIFTFAFMTICGRLQGPSSTSTCSSWVWRFVQEFVILLHTILTCIIFPHDVAWARDNVAPFESSAGRFDLLLLAYVSRFTFLTIPMLSCVIFNSVDLGVTEEWPFIYVMVVSLLLICVYLAVFVTYTCFGWGRDEILHKYFLFGTSFMTNNTTRNDDPESTPPPNDQSGTSGHTSGVPAQAASSTFLSRNANAQPVQPNATGQFTAFKNDQNFVAFFPEQNEENQVRRAAAGTDPRMDCGICFSSDSDMIALSCGHIVCQNCLAGLRGERRPCPFCRKPITSTIKLYL